MKLNPSTHGDRVGLHMGITPRSCQGHLKGTTRPVKSAKMGENSEFLLQLSWFRMSMMIEIHLGPQHWGTPNISIYLFG